MGCKLEIDLDLRQINVNQWIADGLQNQLHQLNFIYMNVILFDKRIITNFL